MKKILITAMACLWAAMAFANHWTPNSNFEKDMTVTAVVQINGVEQGSENLELGVFCGEECRGSQRPIYIQALNRYVYFTQVYGLETDVFHFKLFDHSQGEDLELVSPAAIAFNLNGYGSLSNPHILNFTETVVINYTVTANPDPIEGGSIVGAGTYYDAQACSLVATANDGYAFLNWTENGDVVSTSECYSFVVIANRDLVAHFVPSDSHWLVNDDFGFDMTLTGVVQINGIEQRSETLELGVFCGDECRGAQRPTYIERLDRYICFTHIYGLETDLFTFKLYDHGSNAVLDLISPEAVLFDEGGYGTLASPQVLNFTGAVFQIDVEANYDEGGTVNGAGLYNQGATATLAATPNEGYSFVNWMKDGEVVSTNPSISFTVEASATCQVNYFQETPVYHVTATANPTNGGTVAGGGTFEQGLSCTLTASANLGYTFVNWTKNDVVVSTEANYTFVVNETATYVANFSLNSYDITVNVNLEEGGVVTGAGTYSHGTTVVLQATANEGYSFLNWTRNGTVVSSNMNYSFSVTGSATYVANFALNSYQVTATADPVGGNTITGAGTYDHGATVVLTAVADEGYAFLNWTENGDVVSISESYSFVAVSNRNLVAHFVASETHWLANDNFENDMTLTGVVQINGVEQRSEELELGVFCGDECRGAQKPTYVAVLDRYVYFTQIYGQPTDEFTFKLYDHGSNMELDLLSPEAILFDADGYGILSSPLALDFTGLVFQIDVEANYVEGGTVTGGGYHNYGSTCTLTATPNECNNFLYWEKQGVILSNSPVYSFEVTSNGTYTAYFTPILYTQEVSLTPGWNWWAPTVQCALSELETALGTNGLTIMSKDATATYSNGQWSGTLSELALGEMYRIKTTNTCEFTLNGTRPSSVTLTLTLGQNWFGCTGTEALTIATAFANFTPNTGDKVISQEEGFAIYNGTTWEGTLTTLQPGHGYVYVSQGNTTQTAVFGVP